MDWTSILIAGAVAGVVLFVWYGLAWMALPHHKGEFASCPNKAAVEQALASVPATGRWYMLPFCTDFPGGMKDPALAERMKRGPNATLLVMPAGNCMGGGTFAAGFVLNLIEGLGLALLAALAGARADTLGERIGVFAGAAAFVAAGTYFMQAVYAKHPARGAWTNLFDKVAGYALVAVALQFVGTTAATV